MLKSYKVPVPIGGKILFKSAVNGVVRYLVLTSVTVKDDRMEWVMTSDKGHTIVGNAFNETHNPLYEKNCWIKPSIPITMHLRKEGLVTDFMFRIPGSVAVQVE